MKLLVTPNNDKQGIYDSTVALCNALHEHGARVIMMNSDRDIYKGCCDISGDSINELTRLCDAVIAIGGDGTILRSATIAAVCDKPILGLNQGRLGFMAGLETGELELISRLFTKEYEILLRLQRRSDIFVHRSLLQCFPDAPGQFLSAYSSGAKSLSTDTLNI